VADPQPGGGNRALASPQNFQKRASLLGATSFNHFGPRKYQPVTALVRGLCCRHNDCLGSFFSW